MLLTCRVVLWKLGLSVRKAFFMTAALTLQQLIQIHDDSPDEVIAQLPGLIDSPALPPADHPRLAWLINHLLGEQKGDWRAAWTLLRRLPLSDAGPILLRHSLVAATLSGDALEAWRLERQWLAAGADAGMVRLQARLGVLQGLRQHGPLSGLLPALDELLQELEPVSASADDAALASLANNIVSGLLEREDLDDDSSSPRIVWRAAQCARRLWGRAGNWVHHERAEYLLALAANRFAQWRDGLQAADAGLALIADNSEEDVDRAFLLLERARACFGLGRRDEGELAYQQAQTLAAAFDASLRPWFDGCASRARTEGQRA